MSLDGYTIKDLEKVITSTDAKKVNQVDIARLAGPGENYISLVFSVDVLVEDGAGRRETVKAVAKRLPLVPETQFNISNMAMKNEIRFYSELLPLLTEFAEKYGIIADCYPKHLGSRLSLDPKRTEPDSEAVLLVENLLPQGYNIEDRHRGFDLETAKAVLKALAQFHGIPMALKFKNPELFEKIRAILVSPRLPDLPKGGADGDALPPSCELLLENMLKVPACEPYLQNIKKLQENLPSNEEQYRGGGKEPWSSITHGDFWVNNMLVKRPGRASSTPLVKLIDFQMCFYSSFARDLVFFLLVSVRDEVQKTHIDDLLRFDLRIKPPQFHSWTIFRHYYDELTSLLAKIDVPELRFSYEEYLQEVNRVAIGYEVVHSLFFCSVVFAPKGNQKDHLIGEVNMFEEMKAVMSNMGERQKEKIGLVVELCAGRGWM